MCFQTFWYSGFCTFCRRLTLGWPVYAFRAEALGRQMFNPPDQAPGSDPGLPGLSLEHPEDIPDFAPVCEIA